jgi:hypothetical protein
MLPFPMFSSTNPRTSRPTPSYSFTSSSATSSVPQSFPTFSTASKHPTHSNACNSIRFMHLLHSSLDTRGWGSHYQAKHFSPSPFCFQLNPLPTLPLTPSVAILTYHVNPNSCICNAYKKLRGVRPTPLRATSAHSVSLRYPFSFLSSLSSPDATDRPGSPSLRRYLFTSGRRIAALLPSQVHETHFAPLASHHMQAVPCGGSIQNQTRNTKYGGDCA